MQEYSVGEWIQRRIDRRVGVVVRVDPYNDDFVFYVDFDGRGELWAGTTSAWEPRFRLHAHVYTDSRDCDGDYSGGYVTAMTLADRCDQFGDFRFKERVVANVVSLHGYGTLTVNPEGVSWNEQTEEGYRRAEVRWCENPCEVGGPAWQRDHRAEDAGY